MTRLHVHLNVKDISESVDFYRALFNHAPSVLKPDYAKWDLEDPSVNFTISTQGEPGLQHMGIEARDETELHQLYQRINGMDAPKLEPAASVSRLSPVTFSARAHLTSKLLRTF